MVVQMKPNPPKHGASMEQATRSDEGPRHHSLSMTLLSSSNFFNTARGTPGTPPHVMQLADAVELAKVAVDGFYRCESNPLGAQPLLGVDGGLGGPFSAASLALRQIAPSDGVVDISRSHHAWLVVEESSQSSQSNAPCTNATLSSYLELRLNSDHARSVFRAETRQTQQSMISLHVTECRTVIRRLLLSLAAVQELSMSRPRRAEGPHGIVRAPLGQLSVPVRITPASNDFHQPDDRDHVDDRSKPTNVRYASLLSPATITYEMFGTPTVPNPVASLVASLVVNEQSSGIALNPLAGGLPPNAGPYLSPAQFYHGHSLHPRGQSPAPTVCDDLWSVGVIALEWLTMIAQYVHPVAEAENTTQPFSSLFRDVDIKSRYRNIRALCSSWRRLRGDGRTEDMPPPQQTSPKVLAAAKALSVLGGMVCSDGNDDAEDGEGDMTLTLLFRGGKRATMLFIDMVCNVCLEWDASRRWGAFRRAMWRDDTSGVSSVALQRNTMIAPPLIEAKPCRPNFSRSTSLWSTMLGPFLRLVMRTSSAEHGHLNVLEVGQQAAYLEWARLLLQYKQAHISTVGNTNEEGTALIDNVRVAFTQDVSPTALSALEVIKKRTIKHTNPDPMAPLSSFVDSMLGGRTHGLPATINLINGETDYSTYRMSLAFFPNSAHCSGSAFMRALSERRALWETRQHATNGACNVSLLDNYGVQPAPLALMSQSPPPTVNNVGVGEAPVLAQVAYCVRRDDEKDARKRRHHHQKRGELPSGSGNGGSPRYLLPAYPTVDSRNELYSPNEPSPTSPQSSANSSAGDDDYRESGSQLLRTADSHGSSPSRHSMYASARCKGLSTVFAEEPPTSPVVLEQLRAHAMDPSVTPRRFADILEAVRVREQALLEAAFERFCGGPWSMQLARTPAEGSDETGREMLAYFQRTILWSAGTRREATADARDQACSLRVPTIPTCLRALCWAKLLDLPASGPGRHEAVDLPYQQINTYKPSGSDRQIAVDIPRCHQYHHRLSTTEGHRRLTRILRAWLYDVEHGSGFVYWQGVDSVAAVALTTDFEDEALSCALLQRIVERYVPHYFNKTANTMDHRLATYHLMLKYVDPEVALHLEDIGCKPELYTISWFLTLFAHILPIEKVVLLWDAMLRTNHAGFSVCVAVSIISQLRDEIGKREFSDVVTLLSTGSVQSVLNVAVAAEDAMVLFHRIPPSIINPRFVGSHGTLVASSCCGIVEVGDLLDAFNSAVPLTCPSHDQAGALWAASGVFLIDLRLDDERVRGAEKWAAGGTQSSKRGGGRGGSHRGGSLISSTSHASSSPSGRHPAVRVPPDEEFVFVDHKHHDRVPSSDVGLNGEDDDGEEAPREVILGAIHCPFDGLDGWAVDDVIAQLCQKSLMWLPATAKSNPSSHVHPNHAGGSDVEDATGADPGGQGLVGTCVSAIQTFMSSAPHVVLVAGSNPESAQAAALELMQEGTACVSILAGGVRSLRSGFPSIMATISPNA